MAHGTAYDCGGRSTVTTAAQIGLFSSGPRSPIGIDVVAGTSQEKPLDGLVMSVAGIP
jgi:hypothetical protein